MNADRTAISLPQLLANLKVDVTMANYHRVEPDWRRDHFVHTFNRMYYIVEGEGLVEVDGKRYFPKPGQLVVMPCHVCQSYSTISDNRFLKYWCHFNALVGSRDLFELYRFPVCVEAPNSSEIARLFGRILEHKELNKPTSDLYIHAAMLELIAMFLECSHLQSSAVPLGGHKLDIVLHYIDEHLHEPITVEQLAQLVHYHPNYFIRTFHSILGCSPIRYINRLRLEKARQLLHTSMDITDIARKVGIEPHNFSSMFKKQTGFSPRAYRQTI